MVVARLVLVAFQAGRVPEFPIGFAALTFFLIRGLLLETRLAETAAGLAILDDQRNELVHLFGNWGTSPFFFSAPWPY